MWGQIDGINKIVIAKDVVEGLVRSLPVERRLGFVAYGHRNKGDCDDIETLAEVGAEREAVISKLRDLSPTGKTPLSKSVEHAATALNYTKNRATVILVSDGLETCDIDPCALAKTLEENGLDFTVHVVGFDVTEEERAGLQCIAEETGGEFLAADNADQLGNALAQVAAGEAEVKADESKVEPVGLFLKATILADGPPIQSDLSWKVLKLDEADTKTGDPVFAISNTGYADTVLPPGEYVAEAVWTGWRKGQPGGGEPKSGRKRFTIAANTAVVTVPVELGIPVLLEAPASTSEGVPFEVTWSGPDSLGAYVQVNSIEDGPRETIYGSPAQKARDAYKAAATKTGASETTLDTDGDGDFDQDDKASVKIGGPSIAGAYEVRYVLSKPRLILARKTITVTDSLYTVSAPPEIQVASKFKVDWSGPLTKGDFITIEKAGLEKASTPKGGRPPLKQGEATEITAPAEPGDYEVRYVLANGYTLYPGMQTVVQATQAVRVVDVTAKIEAPETAVGGSTITVQIEPPSNWEDDTISVVKVGAAKTNADARYTLSRIRQEGGSFQLRVPAVPGEYELAYFINPGTRVVTRLPLSISQAEASVSAPATVRAGDAIEIAYSGDGFAGDRIIVCPADTPDEKMWSWGLAHGFAAKPDENLGTYTENQSKRRLVGKPGLYEARYVTGMQNVVIARDEFVVAE